MAMKIDPKMERNLAMTVWSATALNAIPLTQGFIQQFMSVEIIGSLTVSAVVGVISLVEVWRLSKRKFG
jgi:hypothetical protein